MKYQKSIMWGNRVIVCFLFCVALHAQNQWQYTGGPNHATVISFTAVNDTAFLIGTQYGGVYRCTYHSPNSTQKEPTTLTARTVYTLSKLSPAMFAAGTEKGLYVSTDTGFTWKGPIAALPMEEITACASRDGNTILCAIRNQGMMISHDGGSTWETTSISSGTISGILYRSGGITFAASDNGVFISTDNGAMWYPSGLSGKHVTALGLTSSGTLLAGTKSEGIYVSMNEGNTWQVQQLATPNPVVRVFQSLSDTLLYAGTLSGLYLSKDQGFTWEKIRIPKDLKSKEIFPVHDLLATKYDLFAACGEAETVLESRTQLLWKSEELGLPATTDEVFYDALTGSIFARTQHGILINSGQQWSLDAMNNDSSFLASEPVVIAGEKNEMAFGTKKNGLYRYIRLIGMSQTSDSLPSLDIACAAVDRLGRYIIGVRNEGIAISEDEGRHWEMRNSGLSDHDVSAIAVSENYILIVGTEHGRMYRSINFGATWVEIARGLATSPVTGISFGTETVLMFSSLSDGVFRSQDGGQSWQVVRNGLPAQNIYCSLAVGSEKMFAGTDEGVFASLNSGVSWEEDNSGLPVTPINSITISGDGRIQVATRGHGVYKGSEGVAPVRQPFPRLVVPSNLEVLYRTSLHFRWDYVPNVTYEFQIARDSMFQTLITSTDTLVETGISVENMPANVALYWRVRGLDSTGKGGWSSIRSFVCSYQIPVAPTLLYPEDGIKEIPTSIAFQWRNPIWAEICEVQVSTRMSFDSLTLKRDSLLDGYTPFELNRSTTYYWRVRGKNALGIGTWSQVWSFRTQTLRPVPAPPTLVTPSDGATMVPATTQLVWKETQFSDTYFLQVARDEAFWDKVIDTTYLMVTSLPVKLEPNRVYYWRVRAGNDRGIGVWCKAWSFVTGDGPPKVPTLLFPSADMKNTALDIQFVWNASSGAEHYQFDLDISPAFTAPIIHLDALSDTALLVTQHSQMTTYYWRVRSSSSGGTSEWSEIRQFTTGYLPLVLPVLLTPEQGSQNISQPVFCMWQAVDGATSYDIQVGENLTTIEFEKTFHPDTVITLPPLKARHAYVWRVRAQNSFTKGSWSDVFLFTTDATTSASHVPGVTSFRIASITPNPVINDALVFVESSKDQQLGLTVYDSRGSMVVSYPIVEVRKGNGIISLQTRQMAPGIHFVVLTDGSSSAVLRFMKQ